MEMNMQIKIKSSQTLGKRKFKDGEMASSKLGDHPAMKKPCSAIESQTNVQTRMEHDDSEGEVDEDSFPSHTYREIMESFPQCVVYDKEMETITSGLTHIPKKILETLYGLDRKGEDFSDLRELASELTSISTAKPLRIGLLGDAGAGKSSALISVTDIQDLAKSFSGGQSCTCVPTEYGKMFPGQKNDFAAKLEYFDLTKIRELLEEWIQDYNRFTHKYDEYWEVEEKSTYQCKKQNAVKTFQILFCDLRDFRNAQATENLLDKSYQSNSPKALDIMMESCELKLKSKLTPNNGYSGYVEADSCAKLREMVDPLMSSDKASSEPALWPLVKRVCFGIHGSRVLERVTLVDLPGISDTNLQRVDLIKHYVQECCAIWLVAPLSRVVDNRDIDHLLSRYGKSFKGKVAVICTRSDEGVEPKLVKYLSDQGVDLSAHQSLSQVLKGKEAEQKQLEKSYEQLLRCKKSPEQGLYEQLLKIEKKRLQIKQAVDECDSECFSILVTARNQLITEQLQLAKRDHLPVGHVLNVFCISNLHYDALKGAMKIRGPMLAADATGIPALRAFALRMAAPNIRDSMNKYISYDVALLIKKAELWVGAIIDDQQPKILELVQTPEKRLEFHIQGRRMKFEKIIAEWILDPLRKSLKNIVDNALGVFGKKKKKHGSTILAFIRKNGNHSTTICPKECWNEQFSKVASDVVVKNWSGLERGIRRINDEFRNDVVADLQAAAASLAGLPCVSPYLIQILKNFMDVQIVGINDLVRRDTEKYLERDLRNIQLNITQHSNTNYFSQSIRRIYKECNADSGHGVVSRSLERIETFLNGSRGQCPFEELRIAIQEALKANDGKHITEGVQNKVQNILRQTYDTCERQTSADDDEENRKKNCLSTELDPLRNLYAAHYEDFKRIEAKYESA